MHWAVEFLNDAVQAQLESLSADLIASFYRVTRLIEIDGLQKVHEPYVKHLDGPIWEIRMKSPEGIARAAYVTVRERRVIIVHVFRKKTQKTLRRDIEIALKRAREVR